MPRLTGVLNDCKEIHFIDYIDKISVYNVNRGAFIDRLLVKTADLLTGTNYIGLLPIEELPDNFNFCAADQVQIFKNNFCASIDIAAMLMNISATNAFKKGKFNLELMKVSTNYFECDDDFIKIMSRPANIEISKLSAKTKQLISSSKYVRKVYRRDNIDGYFVHSLYKYIKLNHARRFAEINNNYGGFSSYDSYRNPFKIYTNYTSKLDDIIEVFVVCVCKILNSGQDCPEMSNYVSLLDDLNIDISRYYRDVAINHFHHLEKCDKVISMLNNGELQ